MIKQIISIALAIASTAGTLRNLEIHGLEAL
jgi:hypothetical protein